jgi:phosphoglycolate phosphatase-like HAD superfamily hydrolase
VIKNILFDFDGVILDSMPVRSFGFRRIFQQFDKDLVEKLLEFHNLNGGLSRYVKIKYFYEELLKRHITDDEVRVLAEEFSIIMREELIDKKYLIKETVELITNKYEKYNFHIVSGSDEKELKFLCKKLELGKYFKSIHGSPTNKNELVKNVLGINNYINDESILIGDSINDFEAAEINNIRFYGYNNDKLEDISYKYLYNYEEL